MQASTGMMPDPEQQYAQQQQYPPQQQQQYVAAAPPQYGAPQQSMLAQVEAQYLRYERDPEMLYQYAQASAEEREKLLMEHIEFGTAGLRGKMAWGWKNMNVATVMKATQGLCAYYLGREGHGECRRRGVVIGFDGRYRSRYFAHVAAAIFMCVEVPVYMHDEVTATPMTPFMVKRYGALCGIQITASHNPKADNGYKVYGSNGAQICSPMDKEVHQLIMQQQAPWAGVDSIVRHHPHYSINLSNTRKLLRDPFPDAVEAYKREICRTLRLFPQPQLPPHQCPKVVYTAMHGVGYGLIHELLEKHLNLAQVIVPVESQKLPDPEFSTVKFPNPEEAGALNESFVFAEQVGAELVIANDPDADRFAAAEKTPHGWRQFTGDEVAILFSLFLVNDLQADPNSKGRRYSMVRSAVSSAFIDSFVADSAVARNFDIKAQESLTGFKWIMKKAFDEENASEQRTPILCYEEALGYALTPKVVPDKDGVSAAAYFVTNYLKIKERGMTLVDYMEMAFQEVGYFATQNSYYIAPQPSLLPPLFKRFRDSGYPEQIGGVKVTRVRDLAVRYDSHEPARANMLPPCEMLTIYFENNVQITWRGSGTEPKLKYYAQIRNPHSMVAAKAELDRTVAAVRDFFLGPAAHNFTHAPTN